MSFSKSKFFTNLIFKDKVFACPVQFICNGNACEYKNKYNNLNRLVYDEFEDMYEIRINGESIYNSYYYAFGDIATTEVQKYVSIKDVVFDKKTSKTIVNVKISNVAAFAKEFGLKENFKVSFKCLFERGLVHTDYYRIICIDDNEF